VSKVYRPGADTDYLKSSYQYLSLEQLRREESSLKADIWQLGCCFAMLVSVAIGGTSALNRLWSSFEHTDENCSCNIAKEHEPFMKTFVDICAPRSAAWEKERLCSVVTDMLDLDPSKRIDIETVKIELEELPRDHGSPHDGRAPSKLSSSSASGHMPTMALRSRLQE